MKLRDVEGLVLPHCLDCGAPMRTIIAIPHSREFCPKCDACNVVYAGHPIQTWLREHPEALAAETWWEIERSTDPAPFRAMLDQLMLTPERFNAFVARELEKRRG
jgi:hypothetical protein